MADVHRPHQRRSRREGMSATNTLGTEIALEGTEVRKCLRCDIIDVYKPKCSNASTRRSRWREER